MKKMKSLTYIIVLSFVALSCDENEIMPSYQKKGSTTNTVATLTASKTSPLPGESITITMEFVNPASDPIANVVLRARVGSGSFKDIQTFDENSAAKDTEISHEVNYVMPATPGTVTFEMVISSQMEYPQVRRTAVTAK